MMKFAMHISSCPDCIAEEDGHGDLHAVSTCPEADQIFADEWDLEVQRQIDLRFADLTAGLE